MAFENNPISLALFLGSLSLIPLLFITTTAFLKITMVLMIVRNALGVQQVPPSMAIYSIALAATLFVMAPVFTNIQEAFIQHGGWEIDRRELSETINMIVGPMSTFMAQNVDANIQYSLINTAKEMWPESMAEKLGKDNLFVLIPSFVISELQAGFKIGFLIYIPFVVIDLIVSNILLALGMQMVAPITVTVPIKILLFVLVDGWSKLLEGLIYSYV
ncbi:EscR/YscR/HrcR family type III secretion system export apparatus protein [Vibrio splendidus]|uniref:EscR/YscR/HrcR family type III secretion system export apparatus protein n=1 Tax=Vibrio lentus TaxID=136468 RepID=A0A855IS41_9VIBR|nr:type III secretion system export apparatus subunit SctR [Vibrio lentus]PHN83502.1 EscR/YscR/HrcR family type III secretion system export apparatus protein [Vibrio splendidus]MCB5361994.1 EscR/YscR/HrcR family type III secretion system export apparatus protein [Vibrio lentus]MCB5452329.1 EscR/YscR/HrcR family type III secretion system export apparatus protein [Vibrio lentus]MCB5464361.1 EscR/YscR/HrcR family type III secretion system export apparatus protein [Vibrio lentus]MCB5464538.1 EscR/